jgi:hypothetical protein
MIELMIDGDGYVDVLDALFENPIPPRHSAISCQVAAGNSGRGHWELEIARSVV